MFECIKAIGRCVYAENDGTCTLICDTGRPKGAALCDTEDVSDEEEKITFEGMKDFLMEFSKIIKDK